MPTTQAADGLGRVFNTVTNSGQAIALAAGQALSYFVNGSTAVLTLTIATSFGGTYRASNFFTPNWTPITRVYWSLQPDGTAVWNKATITAAATYTHGTTAGLTTAVASVWTLFGPQVPDTYLYVKGALTGSGTGHIIVHDLGVQRTPANLVKLSA
jgi:hypothetical protein